MLQRCFAAEPLELTKVPKQPPFVNKDANIISHIARVAQVAPRPFGHDLSWASGVHRQAAEPPVASCMGFGCTCLRGPFLCLDRDRRRHCVLPRSVLFVRGDPAAAPLQVDLLQAGMVFLNLRPLVVRENVCLVEKALLVQEGASAAQQSNHELLRLCCGRQRCVGLTFLWTTRLAKSSSPMFL